MVPEGLCMCTWNLAPVYNCSRFLDEDRAHQCCCFLFCSDLETSMKPKGRDDHTGISLRIHLLITWQMKCFCPVVTNSPIQGLYVLNNLTINIGLPPSIRTEERFILWVLYIFKQKNEFYRTMDSNPRKNNSRQFYRSLHMIPIWCPLLAWLASGLCKFKEVLSAASEANVKPWCL